MAGVDMRSDLQSRSDPCLQEVFCVFAGIRSVFDAEKWHLRTKGAQAELKANPFWEMSVTGESEDAGVIYFGVESSSFSWKDRMADVHILIDDTERKKKEHRMYHLAYVDPLTGLNNRRYAMERMKGMMEGGASFVMSFVEIDYLKYCNDTLGHKSGDESLMEMAGALTSLGREVCRIGGDEFLLIQAGASAACQDERLEKLRRMLREEKQKQPYPRSFSFASQEIPSRPERSLEDYIKRTDAERYRYKLKNKKPLSDLLYEDQRH